MDLIGLDIVENIEEHYIEERDLTRTHVDWLHENYVTAGKLGKKGGKDGLYPKPERGSQTMLFFLNLGTAEPLDTAKALNDVNRRGKILSLNVEEGGKSFETIGHDYRPDGIGKIPSQLKRHKSTDCVILIRHPACQQANGVDPYGLSRLQRRRTALREP